jgi:hypothetical protein
MAHRILVPKLFATNPFFPLPLLKCLLLPCNLGQFTGFRCGLWQPPMAHKIVLYVLCVLISCPALSLSMCPLFPETQCQF